MSLSSGDCQKDREVARKKSHAPKDEDKKKERGDAETRLEKERKGVSKGGGEGVREKRSRNRFVIVLGIKTDVSTAMEKSRREKKLLMFFLDEVPPSSCVAVCTLLHSSIVKKIMLHIKRARLFSS